MPLIPSRSFRARVPVLLVIAAIACPLPAIAELEEIVVVAQKREQSLQDVPIAVSAYEADALSAAGIRDIRDLTVLSPSLVLTSSQSETAGTVARIRGVGTTGDNLGLESSVAVFVDGVYRNRNNVALTDLGEIERIEVLRGPQGTLFGKNASAGLIHIITKAPDPDEFSAFAEGSLGDYDYYRVGGGATGPILGEQLAFRLDATATERDGFVDDIVSGEEYNDRDRYLVRGQLTSQLTENLDLRFIADFADREETCCAAVTLVAGPTAGVITALGGTMVLPPRPFDRDTTANPNRGYDQDTQEWGSSLELNWQVGPGTLTSITAYRDWDSDRSQDIDFTNADILYRQPGTYGNDFQTLTQELRFQGQSGALDWLIGAYYLDEELDVRDAIRAGGAYESYANLLLFSANPAGGLTQLSTFSGLPPGSVFTDGQGAASDTFDQDTDGWAIFTHNTWAATDSIDLTVGVRYTHEEKDLAAAIVSDNPACDATAARVIGGIIPPDLAASALTFPCLPFFSSLVDGNYADSRDDDEVTGTIALSYAFAPQWQGYLSYGRGYKAGGFNLDRAGLQNPLLGTPPSAADLEFDAETVDSYELGAKGILFDNTVSLNVALFLSQFDDFQLNSFVGTNFVVENVGEVDSKGVEVEWLASLTDNLTLQGGVAYTDATYDSDVRAPLSDRRLTNAPYWVVTAAATYERPITTSLTGFIHANYRFNGDMNTGSDLDAEKKQSSYAVTDARIGVRDADERWIFEIWGRNVFDRDYRQVVFDAPLQGSGTGAGSTQTFNAFLGDPATYGATLRVNF